MPRFRLQTLLGLMLLLGGLIGGVGMRWRAAANLRENVASLEGVFLCVGGGYSGDEWRRSHWARSDFRWSSSFVPFSGNNSIEYVSVSEDTPRHLIDDQVLQVICRLPSLQHLNLEGVSTSQLQLERLTRLKHLETIALENTDFTDQQLASLGESNQIKSLRLAGTDITDRGLAVVANFPQLISLDISYTAITDEGLKQLERCKQLKIIWASETNATTPGLDQLQAALPDCEVLAR
ncbi:hypothetical protein [Bremerella cremea]|nr:hypothetical protein [Bremerella cremea]